MIKTNKGKIIDYGFNLSYSAYSNYQQSQLMFYFQKILYANKTDKVFGQYGDFGNCIHNTAEFMIKNPKATHEQITNFYIEQWKSYDLDNQTGFRGRSMDKQLGFNYVLLAKKKIETEFLGNFIAEEHLEFRSEEFDNILIKGFIDVVDYRDDGVYLFDWKTNSQNTHALHESQRKFYSWLFWKVKGIIPKKCTWYYLKGDKERFDSYTEEDMIKFNDEIKGFIKDIKQKGNDISQYEILDINSPFNAHKSLCIKEAFRRNNKDKLIISIQNNHFRIESEIPKFLYDYVNKYFSYPVKGAFFTDAYKRKVWDGRKTFLRKNSLPMGFLNKFKEIVEVYNKTQNANLVIQENDMRTKEVTEVVYNTKFAKSNKKLRYYQEDAIKAMLEKKIMIVHLGTGGGKTLLTAEAIKRLNRRTLFLINRKELATQTKIAFEDYFGVKVGLMMEGKMDTSNQITVSIVQTLCAILKRNDESSKELRNYLYNVSCVVFDETHNVKDSGMYGIIRNEMRSTVYSFGLSATPYKLDGSTLEMNSVVGFPGYTKSSKELEDEGFLCPTKHYMVKMPPRDFTDIEEYPKKYKYHIVEHQLRNQAIVDFVSKFRSEKKIMIVVKSVDHGKVLNEMIEDSFFIHGDTKPVPRKEMMEEYRVSRDKVMIAMTQIVSAGLDIPDMDIVVYGTAHKSSIDTTQIAGRTKRKVEGKEFGYVIDFLDQDIYFNKNSLLRIKASKNDGNEIIEVDNIGDIDLK